MGTPAGAVTFREQRAQGCSRQQALLTGTTQHSTHCVLSTRAPSPAAPAQLTEPLLSRRESSGEQWALTQGLWIPVRLLYGVCCDARWAAVSLLLLQPGGHFGLSGQSNLALYWQQLKQAAPCFSLSLLARVPEVKVPQECLQLSVGLLSMGPAFDTLSRQEENHERAQEHRHAPVSKAEWGTNSPACPFLPQHIPSVVLRAPTAMCPCCRALLGPLRLSLGSFLQRQRQLRQHKAWYVPNGVQMAALCRPGLLACTTGQGCAPLLLPAPEVLA